MDPVRRFKWRKLVRVLHRDIGYTVTALTLAYAISGLAVNHIDDWNPNYSFETVEVEIGPLPTASPPTGSSMDEMEAYVVERLELRPELVKGRFMETQTELRVFFGEGEEVVVDTVTGRGSIKRITTHPVLYEANVLHLNTIKGWWTWVADLFAVSLVVLAVTGLLMIKGRLGFWGRGKWFVAAGLAVPLGFIAYMVYGA